MRACSERLKPRIGHCFCSLSSACQTARGSPHGVPSSLTRISENFSTRHEAFTDSNARQVALCYPLSRAKDAAQRAGCTLSINRTLATNTDTDRDFVLY